MTVTIDVDTALEFLHSLYQNSSDEGWVNLFSVDRMTGERSAAWAPITELFDLGTAIGRFASRGDVWFGVAPRRARLDRGRRGGVDDCLSIPGLWLDVDVAGDGHRLPGLPSTYEQATRLVKRFPLGPTAVVRSGYGLQPWWLLSETVPANEAIGLLKRWHVTWARLADEVGVHLDNVANLDRVMRLPGTANHKGPNPVPVTVRARWTDSHQLGDVVELLDDLPVETAHSRAFTGHLAGSQFNEHIAAGTVLQSLRWTAVRLDPSGDEHWHHPGSANDISATVYADDGHCTIWSETVAAQTGVPTRRPLDPFGLWTWLVHSGDFVAAHAAIGERYGFKDLGLDLDDLDATPDPVTVPRRQPGRLIALTVGKVRPVKVKWLWDGWLPAGKLVALDGDPDTGKSTVSLDLAARVTKGAAMPDGSSGPSSAAVVLLSGEDDLDDTIVWRLMAAGADLDLVTHIQAVEGERGEAPFTIPGDLILLEELVGDVGAAMVVIDVLNEYLDSRVDSHKDQDIRRTLHRLKDVAARTKAAILMLRHLRKESSAKAIYRGGGSIGIVGAARAGWTVAYHPDDEALRVLAPVKMNLTVRPRPLGFKLLPHVEYPCAYVDWRGPVDIGANELLDPPPRPDPDEASALGFASQAIRELLGDGQEMWSKPFNDALNELGVSVRTRARARERLNVQVRQIRKPDKNGEMGWKLWMPRAND